jgi:uncharacterized protein (TIGR00297 family)
MQNFIGILFSILLVFICFVIAYPASKKNPEIARKIIHIGAAQWYFVYLKFFTSPTPALIGLAVVAVLLAISNSTGMLGKALGQSNKKRHWGLVWYTGSIFIMILLSTFGIGGMTAFGVGLLGMGWGDGLAALFGMKFGKHRFNSSKSLEGSAVFFITVTVITFLFTHSIILSVVCGLTGAVFEFTTPFGLDNITVPLVLYVTVAFWPKSAMLLGFALMACLAYKWKHLTAHGVSGAFVLGVLCTWVFGIAGLVLPLLFFVSSNVIGRIRNHIQKEDGNFIEKKNGRRDLIQVLANGLMAILAAVIFAISDSYLKTNVLIAADDTKEQLLMKIMFAAIVMFGAAMTEATSDTWAGEIGRLSKKPPVSLKTGKTVSRGVSGGVTMLGYGGGLLGAAFIAVFWYALFSGISGPMELSMNKMSLGLAVIILSGFAGCIFDSFLGAFFQALYIDADSGKYTEKKKSPSGKDNALFSGIKWMDNDMVNLASNFLSAVMAFIVAMII